MRERGYLEPHDMATAFNMLRANDLIWSFVGNNYLLGKEKMPFDRLLWNCEFDAHAGGDAFVLFAQNVSAKSPGKTRRYHVGGCTDRSVESQNPDLHSGDARRPHCAVEIDLCRDRLYSGPVKFVLSAADHMAGVISAPGSNYSHWANDNPPPSLDDWFADATSHQGSGGRFGTNGSHDLMQAAFLTANRAAANYR